MRGVELTGQPIRPMKGDEVAVVPETPGSGGVFQIFTIESERDDDGYWQVSDASGKLWTIRLDDVRPQPPAEGPLWITVSR